MAGYQPYAISNFSRGLYLAKDPWLAPKDAFVRLVNAQVSDGAIKKRRGMTEFCRMPHQVRGEAVGAAGATTYASTLGNGLLQSGDPADRFAFTDGTQVVTDNGDGTLGGDGTGTIDYEWGTYSVTFNATTTGAVTVDYQYHPGWPITGIYNYYSASGDSALLIWNTKRAARYYPLEGVAHDIVEADTWSGTDSDFIWTQNWQDVMFVCNNHDRIKTFDGTSFSNLDCDIDGDAANEVDSCLMILAHKERLILLRTQEDGTLYPQRARWCKTGDYTDWTNDGYVDAPTVDWIVSAGMIGDQIIVFFERSIWALRYTANADLPFTWKLIVETEGSYAPMSTVNFSRELLTLGPTGLTTTDGYDAEPVGADTIPDIALSFDQGAYERVYGAIVEELREAWWMYPQINSNYSDRILSLNYKFDSWAEYDLAVQCIGYWSVQADLTWDNTERTWDEMEITWDERTTQAGYPVTLGGMYNGYVMTLDEGGTDDGEAISMDILSARMNPYQEQGRKARLGHIDLLVTQDPNISVDIDFYMDFLATPYLTETVAFADPDNAESEKAWIRVYCGATAEQHQIGIKHTAANQTAEIHAIVLWFKPGGRI